MGNRPQVGNVGNPPHIGVPYNRAVLVELVVENYAVRRRVRVRFHSGLNLLTGETGSSRSMVVDAFSLLLGGRASGDMVRNGATRARISGVFEIAPSPRLASGAPRRRSGA